MILEQHNPDLAADEDDLDLARPDELPDPQPVLSEEDYRGCRFIDGEPTPLRRGMFCCRPTRPGTSWCHEHRRIAFGRSGARKRDAA
jgi:hypothetical protein